MPTVLFSDYAYPGFTEGFRQRGWRVVSSNDLNWYAWCWGNTEIQAGSPQAFGKHLIETCEREKPDLLIIGKGCDTNKPVDRAATARWATNDADPLAPGWWSIRPKDLARIREMGTIVIHLDLDSPDSFGWIVYSYLHVNSDACGICCIGVKEAYEKHRQPNVFEFWPAWDTVARTTPECAVPEFDFLLVGTPYKTPNQEFGIPRHVIARVAVELGLDVRVYGGTGWVKEEEGGDSSLEPYYHGFADMSKLHELMARARITYSSFLRRGYRYLNDRVPIAMGAGSFVLMEEQAGLEEEFPEGIRAGYHRYRDIDNLKERLDYWIWNEKRRIEVAREAQEYIASNHTYQHRADLLIREYEAAKARR